MCEPNYDLVEDKRRSCVWRQKRGIEIRVVVVAAALERVSKRFRLFFYTDLFERFFF